MLLAASIENINQTRKIKKIITNNKKKIKKNRHQITKDKMNV